MKKLGLIIAGFVFGLVALLHLARFYFQFSIVIAGWEVPLEANLIGFIVAGILSVWMFLAARSKKWIPNGYHSITACMTFKDARQAIDFYKKVFGAKEKFVMPGPNGQGVLHAEMRLGSSIFMMGDERPDQNCKSAQTLGASPISFYLYVKNVDAFFKKAVDGGATVDMPLQDMFWGDRVCRIKDPFGYLWMVATHTKDLTPQEIKQGAEAARLNK